MATKLVPKPAGIPGKQLDIFDEIVNKQEDVPKRPTTGTYSPIPTNHGSTSQHPAPLPNQKGTFQSFRL